MCDFIRLHCCLICTIFIHLEILLLLDNFRLISTLMDNLLEGNWNIFSKEKISSLTKLTELFYTSTFTQIFPSSSLNFIFKKKITSRNSNCSKSSSSIGSGVRPSNFPSANCPDRSEATKQLERFSSSFSLSRS